MKTARRRDGRADRRGHAVARHLPFDRREDPAPPCRTGRAQARLHHPRRRRPDPAAEAAPRSREHRREALAGARARLDHRRLEEPRADARQGAARRGRDLRERARHRALQGLSGTAEDAERRRLRRSADRDAAAVPRAPGGAAALSRALPLRAGRRVSGHERRAVSLAAADRTGLEEHLLRRRRRPVDLRLARRRSRQHPALREGLPRREGDPAGAQLPLDRAHPRRRLAPDRAQ